MVDRMLRLPSFSAVRIPAMPAANVHAGFSGVQARARTPGTLIFLQAAR